MPHKGRDKSTSFQHFPTGHLLLRISSVVSWVLNRWSRLITLFSHWSRDFHHQANLIIALHFAHQGKKDKLFIISYLLIVLVTSQEEHFTLADAVLGGLCSGAPLDGMENAPSAWEWHKFGYCWPDLHSDPETQELWPQLALLHQQPGGDWDFLSFVLTWDVAVLHQTCGRYRIKNNTRILGVCGGFFRQEIFLNM